MCRLNAFRVTHTCLSLGPQMILTANSLDCMDEPPLHIHLKNGDGWDVVAHRIIQHVRSIPGKENAVEILKVSTHLGSSQRPAMFRGKLSLLPASIFPRMFRGTTHYF